MKNFFHSPMVMWNRTSSVRVVCTFRYSLATANRLACIIDIHNIIMMAKRRTYFVIRFRKMIWVVFCFDPENSFLRTPSLVIINKNHKRKQPDHTTRWYNIIIAAATVRLQVLIFLSTRLFDASKLFVFV